MRDRLRQNKRFYFKNNARFRHNVRDVAFFMCYNRRMYIEFVILDNFVLTFLAGTVAARLCHSRVNVFRAVGASTLGTVVAVFYPYLHCGFWLQLGLKIALWLV